IEPLKKDKPPNPLLPPITTEGKNTFGCMVDGKPYVPKMSSWKKTAYIKGYDWISGTLSIGAHRWYAEDEPPIQRIEMVLHNRVFSKGKYILYTDSTMHANNLIVNKVDYSFKNESGSNWDFFSSVTYNPYAGEMNILRLDTTYGNRIIAGTFWFDAVDYYTNDTIRIRDGRFRS